MRRKVVEETLSARTSVSQGRITFGKSTVRDVPAQLFCGGTRNIIHTTQGDLPSSRLVTVCFQHGSYLAIQGPSTSFDADFA